MRQTAFALILGSCLAAALPAADQQLVNMIMPDAKIVGGINVDSARNSPFGTFLLNHISASDPAFQQFVKASGFNPTTDLREILVASLADTTAAPAKTSVPAKTAAPGAVQVAPQVAHTGLILARGTFKVDKISALAKADGKQTVESYHGATLISDPKNATASAMAFIGTDIVVAGDTASVKAAIDRRSRNNVLDTEITTKVNALSSSQDAWAVSIAPLSSMSGAGSADASLQGALNGDLFKKIRQTSGGVKFGTQIEFSTEMVAMDEKNATALGDVVRFLAGMVSMNAGSPKGAPPAIVSLLKSLTVQTQGNIVSLNLSAPEDQVETLINSMEQSTKKMSGAKI
jgi:hypothetical protein